MICMILLARLVVVELSSPIDFPRRSAIIANINYHLTLSILVLL